MQVASAVIFLCSMTVVLCTKKLDLVFVFDDTTRMEMYRRSNSKMLFDFSQAILDHMADPRYIARAGIVLYSEKPGIANRVCDGGVVLTSLETPTEHTTSVLDSIDFRSPCDQSSSCTDAYAGLMRALDDRVLYWRANLEEDPVMRVIVLFASGPPREGGLLTGNDATKFAPNDGDLDYECNLEDYYVQDQVASALYHKQVQLYVYTSTQFSAPFENLIRKTGIGWVRPFTGNATEFITQVFDSEMKQLTTTTTTTTTERPSTTQPVTEKAPVVTETPLPGHSSQTTQTTTGATLDSERDSTSPLLAGSASAGAVVAAGGAGYGIKRFVQALRRKDSRSLSQPSEDLEAGSKMNQSSMSQPGLDS